MLAASTQKPTSLSSHLIDADNYVYGAPAISQCKTRCYLPCGDCLLKVALPGGEVVRKVDCASWTFFSCGSVVVSYGKDGVSVYDEDLTLLCSLSHEECVTLLLAQKEYDVVCLKELKASQTGDIGFDVYIMYDTNACVSKSVRRGRRHREAASRSTSAPHAHTNTSSLLQRAA